MTCHLLVTPDPREHVSVMLDGRQGFHIKFDDGKLDSDFADFNPDFQVAENSKSQSGKIYKPTVKEGKQELPTAENVTVAKALEWEYLHHWESDQSETEWHSVFDGPERSIDQLRQHVEDAMRLFPNVSIPTNLDMSAASPETQQFSRAMEAIKDYKDKKSS